MRVFGDTRPGGQFLALAIIFVIFFIIAMGISLVAIVCGAESDALWLQAVTQIVCFGGTAFSFAFLFHGKGLAFLHFHGSEEFGGMKVSGVGLLLAALILVCVIPLSDWLANLNESWHFPEQLAWLEQQLRDISAMAEELLKKYLLRDSAGALIANIAVLALVPAICEELLFRGALQQVLCKCFKNAHIAIFVTAAIFSLMHGEVFAFLPRFMRGAVLGYLFYLGRSIWYNILAHFLNNAILVVMYFFVAQGKIEYGAVDNFNSPWYLAVLGLAAAIVLFRRWREALR